MEIAQMVSADHTIFPMIGRYQIYMMDVVSQLVPAGPIIFPHDRPVPDIHNICDRTDGTGRPYHIFHDRPVPDIRDGCERTNGTGRSYHIPHDRPVPDIHNVCDRTNGTGQPYHKCMRSHNWYWPVLSYSPLSADTGYT